MRFKRIITTSAVIAAMGLVLSGCAGRTAPEGGAAPTALDPTASQINAHPVSDLKDGGDLRIPLSEFPEQWNYYHTDGSGVEARRVRQTVMPQSFVFDLDNNPVLDTNYLTKAELVSENPQTIEYQINEKATWSDGSPITWKDYEAVWKGSNGSDEAFLAGDTTGYRDIASVTMGATEKDFTVIMSKPFADWKKFFTVVYPAVDYTTAEQFNEGWLDKIPLTAGPFKITDKSLDKTAQTITVFRDDNWWGDKPKLDSITFRAIEAVADIDAYLNNELDMVEARNTDRYSRVKDAKDTDIRIAPSARYNHVTFGSGGVLSDTETRLALQKAINRESLAQTIYNGMPYKFEVLNNHMFLTTDPAYQDNAKGIVDFDPAAAAKDLDAAGWTVSGDTRVKDGVTLAPRMIIPAATPISQQLAELIQAQLAAVQVKLDIVAVPTDTFFRDYVTPGNFDMTLFVWQGTGFFADGVSIYQTGDNTQNYGKIGTTKIDDLLNETIATLDSTEANKLANEADKLVWEEGHSLPIAQQPMLFAIRPGIANYGAFAANADPDWTTVGWLK